METFKNAFEGLVYLVYGSSLSLAEPVLELCKGLLDGVEVWAIGRQEDEFCAGLSDGSAHLLALVAAEIVEDDDITGLEGGDQELLDVGTELLAIDRAIEEAGCLDPVMPQGGQEGERAPAAVRCLADQSLAAWPPTAQRSHVGFCPGLVDEDQAFGVDARLACSPSPAAPGHVRPVLLSREGGFF